MYGADLEELYSSALVYVLPSEVEGLSISLLEAMSYGLPVLVSDIPGNVEALGQPPAGLVYPLRDRAALAAALQRVSGDGCLRRELGASAVARVQQAYDWDSIADQTLLVYRKSNTYSSAMQQSRYVLLAVSLQLSPSAYQGRAGRGDICWMLSGATLRLMAPACCA